jgi:hypothetical protein
MEKHTWCGNYIEQITLADCIEEFMAARGEYDFHFDDRIRWLKTDDRKGNTKFILSEIQNDNIGYLIDYFKDQLAEMAEDDDLIPVAEDILNDLRKISS